MEERKQGTYNSQCSQPLATLLTSRIHNMVQYTQAIQMPRHIYSNGLWKAARDRNYVAEDMNILLVALGVVLCMQF